MTKRTNLPGIFVVAVTLSLSFLTATQAQACELCTDFTFTYPDGYEEERRMCWYAPTGGYLHCEEILYYVTCQLMWACSVFGGDDRNDFESPDDLFQPEERVVLADLDKLAPPGCSESNRPKRTPIPTVHYTL